MYKRLITSPPDTNGVLMKNFLPAKVPVPIRFDYETGRYVTIRLLFDYDNEYEYEYVKYPGCASINLVHLKLCQSSIQSRIAPGGTGNGLNGLNGLPRGRRPRGLVL
jgi:hypothetical protein